MLVPHRSSFQLVQNAIPDHDTVYSREGLAPPVAPARARGLKRQCDRVLGKLLDRAREKLVGLAKGAQRPAPILCPRRQVRPDQRSFRAGCRSGWSGSWGRAENRLSQGATFRNGRETVRGRHAAFRAALDPIRKSDLAGQDPIGCKFALIPADATPLIRYPVTRLQFGQLTS